MAEIAILGAGELGGSLADIIAERDIVSSVRLIDDSGQVAAGKALDIAQSAPIQRFSTKVSGSTDLTTAAGADLIFVADRASGGEWRGDEGLLLLKRIAQLGSHWLIVCAGSSQRELVERGVRELKCERARLFGCAPEAFAAAVRAVVAVESGASPRDIALTVLGVPPSQMVVPWEDAAIGGLAATSVLAEPARRAIAAKLSRLWPPGPTALAMAAVKAAEAVFGRSRQTFSAFVAPDDSQGRRLRAAALPARVGPAGIELVELPALSARDRIALDNAMLL